MSTTPPWKTPSRQRNRRSSPAGAKRMAAPCPAGHRPRPWRRPAIRRPLTSPTITRMMRSVDRGGVRPFGRREHPAAAGHTWIGRLPGHVRHHISSSCTLMTAARTDRTDAIAAPFARRQKFITCHRDYPQPRTARCALVTRS
jgi:hypothetical protein